MRKARAMAEAKNRTRIWIAAVICVLMAGVGLAVITRGGGSGSAVAGVAEDWYEVERQTLDLKVVATGELESRDRIEVICQVNGRTAISYVIDEGSQVQEGDVLVRLDDQEIRTRLESQQLDVENARLSLQTAQRELEIQENDAASSLKDAQVQLDSAKLDLAKWEQGDVPTKLRDLALAIETAERRAKQTERDLVFSEQLWQQEFISENEYEDDVTAAKEAKNALETARLASEIYDKYEFVKEKQGIETAVEQAEANLERVIARNESNMARYETDVRSKQRTLELREQTLKDTQEQLANTVITAPSPGMVVYATSIGPEWRRDEPLTVGREVRNNESLIFLPDISKMSAVLKVHEALLPQVKVGQRAVIRIDARQNNPVEGTVSSIGVTADSGGWMNPDLREYKVRVDLPESFDLSLKPAMRLSGEVYTGRVEDVLAVPVQAVNAEGENYYVYVPSGSGRVVRRSVEIGQATETMVEIQSGLEEGERVLLRQPRAGELEQSDEG